MKYAILGGSFNPIHMGHLFLADTALSAFGYDRIILVPAYSSPFKLGAQGASPKDRLDMLIASIPADPRLTIDDGEIRREGVSYTIDTIKDIRERYRPEGKPGLILGDDLARDFHKWRSADEIVSLTDIIIARRLSVEDLPFPYPHKRLKNEIVELSSGNVRDRIGSGEAWSYLVPPGARFIIEDRSLYGLAKKPDTAITRERIADIENTVRTMISPSRFLHSRNVALLTQDLCIRYGDPYGACLGMDPAAGYLAGIAHDMCKSLPEAELFRLTQMDGKSVSKLERKKPTLLHARAAAVLLKERFGIHNKDILEAVRLHTMADTEMSPLAKAVFIADKIEVSREHVSAGLRDNGSFDDLDTLFAAVLNETVAYLRSRKLSLSKGTLRLLEVMKGTRTSGQSAAGSGGGF
ncbi:nicotinate-nucleotide adenylyltransferase [Spirochaetia bacterium]|nr:nicotinate-nucleotide adenylyltransferase [Spirochaetia bacterium]GHV29300.1 nicotinate-nucleotide adenylyltransferase [Spirochaetia bacterium]